MHARRRSGHMSPSAALRLTQMRFPLGARSAVTECQRRHEQYYRKHGHVHAARTASQIQKQLWFRHMGTLQFACRYANELLCLISGFVKKAKGRPIEIKLSRRHAFTFNKHPGSLTNVMSDLHAGLHSSMTVPSYPDGPESWHSHPRGPEFWHCHPRGPES